MSENFVTDLKLKVGRWIALQTKEFGWVAGPIMLVDEEKINVRLLRRQKNSPSPSVKDLRGWEPIQALPATYFFESVSFPRIIPLGIIDVNRKA